MDWFWVGLALSLGYLIAAILSFVGMFVLMGMLYGIWALVCKIQRVYTARKLVRKLRKTTSNFKD